MEKEFMKKLWTGIRTRDVIRDAEEEYERWW
jgi:hypothetical protein